MADETFVRLKTFSVSLTPEQITEAIGLPCDRSWRIGDKRGKTIIIEKENGWILNSSLSLEASLDAHVENLLSRLTPIADKIRKFSEQNRVEFSCVVYADSPPALNFTESVIFQLAQLGASLDIDLFLTADDNG